MHIKKIWPLLLGVVEELAAGIAGGRKSGGRVADIAECMYNSGVAAVPAHRHGTH